MDLTKVDKIIIANELYFKQVRESLSNGKLVTLPVKGCSMRPFLRDGDKVLLKAFERRNLAKGLVVLAKTDYGIVLHRVVDFNVDQLQLAGDGNISQIEWVDFEDVFGVAIRRRRDGKDRELVSNWKLALGLVWYKMRPLRKLLNKSKKGLRWRQL